MERDFKGVWIHREIWLSKDLSLMEKVLFAEIDSLDNERGCFASNAYFADFFGVSTRQISTYVSALKAKGFIHVEISNHSERTIRVTHQCSMMSGKKVRQLKRKRDDLADGFRANNSRRG